MKATQLQTRHSTTELQPQTVFVNLMPYPIDGVCPNPNPNPNPNSKYNKHQVSPRGLHQDDTTSRTIDIAVSKVSVNRRMHTLSPAVSR
ncbi:hypothetical protein EYC84_005520 [Monilinia fructicola]|uniref:Uncharacterized protein n=1 Tax=Monilinia fructicola TaxID=38448 RepID=A0A5M9JXL9_MONFR|nr:hypothetical protein EYC84_005520 [Monilinia fructicola]